MREAYEDPLLELVHDYIIRNLKKLNNKQSISLPENLAFNYFKNLRTTRLNDHIFIEGNIKSKYPGVIRIYRLATSVTTVVVSIRLYNHKQLSKIECDISKPHSLESIFDFIKEELIAYNKIHKFKPSKKNERNL